MTKFDKLFKIIMEDLNETSDNIAFKILNRLKYIFPELELNIEDIIVKYEGDLNIVEIPTEKIAGSVSSNEKLLSLLSSEFNNIKFNQNKPIQIIDGVPKYVFEIQPATVTEDINNWLEDAKYNFGIIEDNLRSGFDFMTGEEEENIESKKAWNELIKQMNSNISDEERKEIKSLQDELMKLRKDLLDI